MRKQPQHGEYPLCHSQISLYTLNNAKFLPKFPVKSHLRASTIHPSRVVSALSKVAVPPFLFPLTMALCHQYFHEMAPFLMNPWVFFILWMAREEQHWLLSKQLHCRCQGLHRGLSPPLVNGSPGHDLAEAAGNRGWINTHSMGSIPTSGLGRNLGCPGKQVPPKHLTLTPKKASLPPPAESLGDTLSFLSQSRNNLGPNNNFGPNNLTGTCRGHRDL